MIGWRYRERPLAALRRRVVATLGVDWVERTPSKFHNFARREFRH
jgi:hypothetical protein